MNRPRKGIVHATREFFEARLNFPLGWLLEDIKIVDDSNGELYELIVSGDDFPTVAEDGAIRKVKLNYHKEHTWVSVEIIK